MVSYRDVQEQLSKRTADLLRTGDGKKPELTSSYGKVKISFLCKNFVEKDIWSVIGSLRKSYAESIEISDFCSTYVLKAKRKQPYFDIVLWGNTVELKIRQEYFHDTPTWVMSYEKTGNFKQDEVDCLLMLWEQFSYKSRNGGSRNLEERIQEFGARLYQPDKSLTWNSLAGYDKVKQEVNETVVLPFIHPEVYRQIGALTRSSGKVMLPRAALFEGPPGTGKTTMAKIIGSETDIPLIYVPLESILSCWYGTSEKRLAEIFDIGLEFKKCIMFLDEIDAIAGSRNDNMHEATRRVLSVLLRKMDGLVSTEGVLTLGATNRAQDLDTAILSRFNKVITFPIPNEEERTNIFKHYAKHLDHDNYLTLATNTEGKSGRDIEGLCSNAERSWAAELIHNGTASTPPPFEQYLRQIS